MCFEEKHSTWASCNICTRSARPFPMAISNGVLSNFKNKAIVIHTLHSLWICISIYSVHVINHSVFMPQIHKFALIHGVTWFRSFLLKQRYRVKPLFNMAIKSITETALHLMLCMGYFKSIFWSIYSLLTTPTLFSHVVSAPCLIRASITWACPFSVAQCKGVILSCIKKYRVWQIYDQSSKNNLWQA